MSQRSGSFVILIAVFFAILLIVLPVSAVKDSHTTTIATLHTTAIPTGTTVIPTAIPTISVGETETTGSVMIYSSPAGASILIDGVFSGTTPKTVNGIPAGNQILRLELSRYYDYEGSIYVMPGQTAQGYGTLQPMNQGTSAAPTVFAPVIVPVVTATPVPTQDPGPLGNPSVIIALISGFTVMVAAGVSIYIHLTPHKKE